ncbi:MAG: PspC domain-containing protein [Ruminococcaceae bacterium]|nr:PspC domain-containing protein [Oscillospiraceae bacterium]
MTKKLYRSRTDKKLFGVLGGLANYFNIDPTILRIIYVLLSIFVIGCPVIIYLVAALIIPEEPENTEQSPYQQANYEPVDDNK